MIKLDAENKDEDKKNDSSQTVDEKIKTKLYENRTIFFSKEIDETNSDAFCKELYAMYYENASPINLKLTTYGGYFSHSYRMVASIEEVKKKIQINCECAGAIASGGIDVLLPCSKRLAHPTTTFLLHHHSGGNHGRYDEHIDARKQDDMIAEMRVKQVAKYSNLSYEEAWENMYRKEWWLTPEEMLSYEMLEEIL
jgi:ATP-dependent protease ClpP protease subunit